MPRSDVPSEHFEQREFVKWFRQTFPDVLIFAIPNGGARSPTTAARLKAEGVVPGIPDLFVPAWGLWVEMKRQKGGALSPAQKSLILYLQSLRMSVIVGYGFEDAKAKTLQHLEETHERTT